MVESGAVAKRFEVKKWNAVALWSWGKSDKQMLAYEYIVVILSNRT